MCVCVCVRLCVCVCVRVCFYVAYLPLGSPLASKPVQADDRFIQCVWRPSFSSLPTHLEHKDNSLRRISTPIRTSEQDKGVDVRLLSP